jgi:hypothetical protein
VGGEIMKRKTGYKDKHGRDIHEGDVVRRHHNIERVVWHQDQWKGQVLQFGDNELTCTKPHRWEEAEILDDWQ